MEDDQVVAQDVATDVTESTAVEPDETSASQPQEQPEEQLEPQETPNEKPRSAQGRIKELVAEKKRVAYENQQLREALQRAAQAPIPDEISPEDYRAMNFQAQAVAQDLQQIKLERMQDKLEADTERIYEKHPDLKENKKLDDRLSNAWLENFAQLDANGNIIGYTKSPLQFVEEQMDIINSVKAENTAQKVRAMEQQKADSPVTPEVSATKTPKSPQEMSIKELEAKLGFARR